MRRKFRQSTSMCLQPHHFHCAGLGPQFSLQRSGKDGGRHPAAATARQAAAVLLCVFLKRRSVCAQASFPLQQARHGQLEAELQWLGILEG